MNLVKKPLIDFVISLFVLVLMGILPSSIRAEEVINSENGIPSEMSSLGQTAELAASSAINCSYRTHVQNVGWQDFVSNGAMSGIEGQGLRLEGIEIKLANVTGDVGIEYATQVENIGWQDYVKNGTMRGTAAQALRLEAIKIRLIGVDAKNYDIYYQVHAQNFGWLDWAKNGMSAGTEGFGTRLEGIRIQIVQKGSSAPEPIANELGFMAQLVNKNHSISADYVPSDLVWVNLLATRDTQLRSDAAQHLIQLFSGANARGLNLYCCSGYRSYWTQASLYQWNVDTYGVGGQNWSVPGWE